MHNNSIEALQNPLPPVELEQAQRSNVSETFANALGYIRRAGVVGMAALTAVGVGGAAASESEAAGPKPDWPEFIQPSDPNFDQELADHCVVLATSKFSRITATDIDTRPFDSRARHKLRFYKGNKSRAVLRYDLHQAIMSECDGYIKRTSISRLFTKNRGQKRVVRGASVFDRSNTGKDNVVRVFNMRQRCRKGMIANYINTSVIRTYDGKVGRSTYTSGYKKIDC